jgi:dihydroxyacetone kinase
MAGTVLAYKIAAAAAAEGLSLPEVEKIAQGVAANLGSYGVGLEHCYVSHQLDARSIDLSLIVRISFACLGPWD